MVGQDLVVNYLSFYCVICLGWCYGFFHKTQWLHTY